MSITPIDEDIEIEAIDPIHPLQITSIDKEKENSLKKEIPKIPEPKHPAPFFMHTLVQKSVETEKIYSESAAEIAKALHLELKRFEEFSTKILPETEQALLEQKEALDQWKQFAKIVELLATTFSILLGTSLLINGGDQATYGKVLITVGSLSVANHIITKNKGWEKLAQSLTTDKEKQEKLARGFEFGTTLILSMATILSGTLAAQKALQLGAFSNTLERSIITLSNVAKCFVEPHLYLCRRKIIEQDVKKILEEVQGQLLQKSIRDSSSFLGDFADLQTDLEESLSKSIKTLSDIQRNPVQV